MKFNFIGQYKYKVIVIATTLVIHYAVTVKILFSFFLSVMNLINFGYDCNINQRKWKKNENYNYANMLVSDSSI